jgi:hypothetical protein
MAFDGDGVEQVIVAFLAFFEGEAERPSLAHLDANEQAEVEGIVRLLEATRGPEGHLADVAQDPVAMLRHAFPGPNMEPTHAAPRTRLVHVGRRPQRCGQRDRRTRQSSYIRHGPGLNDVCASEAVGDIPRAAQRSTSDGAAGMDLFFVDWQLSSPDV